MANRKYIHLFLFIFERRLSSNVQGSKDAASAHNGAADASVANLQIFLDTFVCQANTAGIPYFFFEVSVFVLDDTFHPCNRCFWKI